MILKIVLTCLIVGVPVLLLLVYGLCRAAAQADILDQELWGEYILENRNE